MSLFDVFCSRLSFVMRMTVFFINKIPLLLIKEKKFVGNIGVGLLSGVDIFVFLFRKLGYYWANYGTSQCIRQIGSLFRGKIKHGKSNPHKMGIVCCLCSLQNRGQRIWVFCKPCKIYCITTSLDLWRKFGFKAQGKSRNNLPSVYIATSLLIYWKIT